MSSNTAAIEFVALIFVNWPQFNCNKFVTQQRVLCRLNIGINGSRLNLKRKQILTDMIEEI